MYEIRELEWKQPDENIPPVVSIEAFPVAVLEYEIMKINKKGTHRASVRACYLSNFKNPFPLGENMFSTLKEAEQACQDHFNNFIEKALVEVEK